MPMSTMLTLADIEFNYLQQFRTEETTHRTFSVDPVYEPKESFYRTIYLSYSKEMRLGTVPLDISIETGCYSDQLNEINEGIASQLGITTAQFMRRTENIRNTITSTIITR